MSNDLLLKSILGVQYPSYSFFVKYYKEAILKEGNLNVLEVINSMKCCKELRDYSIKEYKKQTGMQEGTSVNVLAMSGPFVAFKKSSNEKLYFFSNSLNYCKAEVTENSVKMLEISRVTGKVSSTCLLETRSYWFVPLVSLYCAAFALGNICSGYNKNGIVISTADRDLTVVGVGKYDIYDLLVGNLTLIDGVTRSSVKVNVLDIHSVKRL